jgi:hypothetical protein
MVKRLETVYAGRVTFRTYWVDQLAPGAPGFDEMRRVGAAVDFRLTPTFLVVDAHGRLKSRYEGTTPYLSLTRDLDAALAAPAAR